MNNILEKDDTISIMDYVYADKLSPDQLLEGDLIEFANEDDHDYQIVEVISITPVEDFEWLIEGKDEFGDTVEFIVNDDEKIKLFVLK
jgi:hypothetical protein